ncbi:MAG TPA: hypothetical protein GXX21_08780 [Syntrophomonadaceae bacterium]|nr:hypothetical protein [Syntrophomonadaceae bacterium]
MKDIKLYNVIFPLWFVLFLPPVILITLVGNFVIDSLVVIACFFIFKLADIQKSLTEFYKGSILKVWIFGFLADIIGASILFIIGILEPLELPIDVITGINYDPFSNLAAVAVITIATLVSAVFIFMFNYRITFAKQINDQKLKAKVAIAVALITMPWTFLLPTKWFY